MTTTSEDESFIETIEPELYPALIDLAAGGLALLVDSGRDRGDFVAVARTVTADLVNSMAAHGRGLISVAITAERRASLALPAMAGSAALASVEASAGVGTGISTSDRALTIRTVADPAAAPDAVICPGHVVPVVAAPGGLLSHCGRIEAAVDIARLADSPAAAICEVLDDSGDLATAAEVRALGDRIAVPVTTIAAVLESRIELDLAGW